MNRIIKVVVALAAISAGPALARGPEHPAPEHYGNQVAVVASEVYSEREGRELGLKADGQISVTKAVSGPISSSLIASR